MKSIIYFSELLYIPQSRLNTQDTNYYPLSLLWGSAFFSIFFVFISNCSGPSYLHYFFLSPRCITGVTVHHLSHCHSLPRNTAMTITVGALLTQQPQNYANALVVPRFRLTCDAQLFVAVRRACPMSEQRRLRLARSQDPRSVQPARVQNDTNVWCSVPEFVEKGGNAPAVEYSRCSTNLYQCTKTS